MNRIILMLCSAGTLWTLCGTGCSTTGPTKPALLNAQRLPSFEYVATNSANYYLAVYTNAASADRARVRNQILSDLMAIIDYNYHQYEWALRDDSSIKDTSVDIVTLGLTAAATASGAEQVKTILSATAAGVIGANASIDKNVFKNNTIQVLQLQMRSLRAEREEQLIRGMGKPDADYPLQAGIRDIVAYYYAGSITGALIALTAEVGAKARSAENAAKGARSDQK
jgi:hypothetical protein